MQLGGDFVPSVRDGQKNAGGCLFVFSSEHAADCSACFMALSFSLEIPSAA